MAAIPALPTLGSDATLEQIRDQLAILQKTITFALTGNLGSQNAYEFGNWLVTEDSLISENQTVGFSTAVTGGDDIRIWAGDATNQIAPFRVYESGHVYMSNLTMVGGNISWDLVNPPTPSDVGALPIDSLKLSNLSSIGDYLGALAQGQVTGLPGKMTYIGAGGIYSGHIGTDQLIAQGALIGTALIDNLVVGSNVTMGPTATISWSNVTSKDLSYSNITGTKPPTNADNTSGSLGAALGTNFTTIGPNYVYTATIGASQINTVNLSAEKIYQPGYSNNYATLGGSFGDLNLYYAGSPYFTVYNNLDGVRFYSGTRQFLTANTSASIGTFPTGVWDFTSCTVQNLSVVAQFG